MILERNSINWRVLLLELPGGCLTKPRGFYILSAIDGHKVGSLPKRLPVKKTKYNLIKKQPFLIGKSMKQTQIRRVLLAFAVSILSVINTQAWAQSLDEVLGVRETTTADGRNSQLKIDELTDQTQDLLTQYKQVMKIVDGLRVYNQQQERLIRNQEKELEELAVSIDNVTIVNRQITPLIERMIDNLETFISLDLPFLSSEREERIAFLRETLDRSDVEVSEKFSQVMQAYQVENSYGATIEAYSDIIDLNGQERQVDMLKWGRVSLVFQSPDGAVSGAWNKQTGTWDILSDDFAPGIRDAIRIARKTQTADIVRLPVPAPGE